MKVVWQNEDVQRVGAILKGLDKCPVFYGLTIGWTGFGVIRLIGGCECTHERTEHDWGENGELAGECQRDGCSCREYRKPGQDAK